MPLLKHAEFSLKEKVECFFDWQKIGSIFDEPLLKCKEF
jgi:hypothetical protein